VCGVECDFGDFVVVIWLCCLLFLSWDMGRGTWGEAIVSSCVSCLVSRDGGGGRRGRVMIAESSGSYLATHIEQLGNNCQRQTN
jgi:hypothetical protein